MPRSNQDERFIARYQGQRVALLTQHGKETLLGPLLHAGIGCLVERVSGFDTDQLGSFTREIPRDGSQLDAARRKARIGMALANCSLGLASEGAFGPDPFTGLLVWNTEIVVWIDDEQALELVGYADGPARAEQRAVGDLAALREFAHAADFPAHHLVLRADSADAPPAWKGLADAATLERAFVETQAQSSSGRVWVENDLRAHTNPTRQAVICKAGSELLALMASACPDCSSPGFRLLDYVRGLPCAWCRQPTREVVAEIWSCQRCSHQERRERQGPTAAPPERCGYCNP